MMYSRLRKRLMPATRTVLGTLLTAYHGCVNLYPNLEIWIPTEFFYDTVNRLANGKAPIANKHSFQSVISDFVIFEWVK